ncbi:dihydropteroatesynthase/2-amino-4-hydroxy-6-hydroxymethyldihydropteridinediphosphokinase/dihydroneopterinaldolase [Schizosaccharomyces cryophilus OY26]|uniref:Folic acid synthesis protein FOL1 n=1 Tax=Schizosaccharomyces cryophilus (strain OY26 / ATCC MYA-4695 / CBS 11777 / NBRC 106824 / NRRL Y48691) TaxID=653667 RepID=S9VTE7_SCHCR|nr:dihydropteroatesynthase/2-amino-4-hydroxy-6-hydroxymethyldihydropteridinediphosphokinase/dihydroneopterinaldolase [Schizosaccharomyces cryophilus OY26]EPY49409.1 dihydropteroatesynthase/2-amino-4-hydroxy-6-hydroxymethyldihydropteridinediphosphokinase/dihydroneopterinaldolase [Schizosaccharomyces cryophilus OY26]
MSGSFNLFRYLKKVPKHLLQNRKANLPRCRGHVLSSTLQSPRLLRPFTCFKHCNQKHFSSKMLSSNLTSMSLEDEEQIDYNFDSILVQNLRTNAKVGTDQWRRSALQPVEVNLRMVLGTRLNGEDNHDLKNSIHYGIASKIVLETIENNEFSGLRNMADTIAATCRNEFKFRDFSVNIRLPKKILRSRSGLVYDAERHSQYHRDSVKIFDLELATIIGIHPFERKEKQRLGLDVAFSVDGDKEFDSLGISDICHEVAKFVETSSFLTIEALVHKLSKFLCFGLSVDCVHIKAEKPSAITFADAPAVQICRSRKTFLLDSIHKYESSVPKIAYISFGSNMGDRMKNIATALKSLSNIEGINLLDVSPLYETRPMYYKDQSLFMNGVCKIETKMSPMSLLRACQFIEQQLGRVKMIDKGPRCIDLDIVMYEDCIYESKELTIPHAGMMEREFVLRPLVALDCTLVHPATQQLLLTKLKELPAQGVKVYATYLSDTVKEGAVTMGVINITPDSFSDGSIVTKTNVVEIAKRMVENGASILDIGGQSTRPHARTVTVQEEIDRVVPVIRAIRNADIQVPISVDTFEVEVAREAIFAGANIINDVSSGTKCPEMLSFAAKAGIPICLMHMRGTPQTMNSLSNYEKDIVQEVFEELNERVQAAIKAGIPRYNIILDPGFGFAKKPEHSVALLNRFDELVKKPEFMDLQWLSGPSRKGFTGRYTNEVEPVKRIWGTAAAVTASVLKGANIVRVHDVEEMSKVITMANAVKMST